MRKRILFACCLLISGLSVFADDENKIVRQETTSCTTINGSVLGNGGSTKTCTTDHADGSKTTTITSCTTSGMSASVGVAKGGFTRETCTTTTINEKNENKNQVDAEKK